MLSTSTTFEHQTICFVIVHNVRKFYIGTSWLLSFLYLYTCTCMYHHTHTHTHTHYVLICTYFGSVLTRGLCTDGYPACVVASVSVWAHPKHTLKLLGQVLRVRREREGKREGEGEEEREGEWVEGEGEGDWGRGRGILYWKLLIIWLKFFVSRINQQN